MKKMERLTRIEHAGVVAVVREDSQKRVIEAARAVIKGGIKGIEVTFSVPQADQVIAQLKDLYQNDSSVAIGAGTVLDAVTARLAILAGAEFVVSPCFDQATAEMCNFYQVPYMPGCMTITEMQQAMKSGADIVKLFPANNFTPQMIKAAKAPLPHVNIMPTGGVNLENIAAWKQAGAIVVGVGGNLFKGVKDENYELVSQTAKQYIEVWREN
ncbi:bifunctional 2-keto-4-hydroxyglutarate aldolase/2-keto-3-deoxy-6-phosphogluconate aldolase [Enterococcus avium]|uniref:bifunctional 2-keto-4-hydroxyglutarate aldolase/2-keto-3-deoxy-6-phosphogluconate aldolase n=1 Tax=Enterococcus avium TaxID=33945 RepID=UPI00232D30D2|nr:bifunctional 2-keto-4-hydroxyglutarate aldolase/2-keto-3-deoxy-6-phosphogluconate aldolase [Enterococcus avium]MDB1749549.1 bifunctional 2-keto-4-hydroxyglutarate aldolase/2-keto-3-deoxy-6-phosphogluconate aldolase [Enterococcus avium]MDB1753756.1 bifunctional 2-keto-4-hydroxyglutarate aldolase/2-keto-3-deoxy-6-phosphogluconate aldolase [Enterococcus avium]MDB1760828.1 bifunctional 2-keto-4-hydroxyglutarate aldolase/2-keto-3-deoxy-6-phosphogluconate aldolase [Enterococcus avium]